MIVPFAPGAATDIEGRIYATKLSEALGQSFVLDFKPGGSMTIGMNQAVRQKPDGHLTGLWLQSSTGTKYTFVHYKAAGASYPDLMVGRAHATPMTFQTSLPRVKAGKVKAIGVASPQRNALLPDLPTFHEQGVTVRVFDLDGLARAGEDAYSDRQQAAGGACENHSASGCVGEKLGAETALMATSPEQFRRHVGAETARWLRLIKEFDISFDDAKN